VGWLRGTNRSRRWGSVAPATLHTYRCFPASGDSGTRQHAGWALVASVSGQGRMYRGDRAVPRPRLAGKRTCATAAASIWVDLLAVLALRTCAGRVECLKGSATARPRRPAISAGVMLDASWAHCSNLGPIATYDGLGAALIADAIRERGHDHGAAVRRGPTPAPTGQPHQIRLVNLNHNLHSGGPPLRPTLRPTLRPHPEPNRVLSVQSTHHKPSPSRNCVRRRPGLLAPVIGRPDYRKPKCGKCLFI
jgi:hypothetical protein